MPHSLSDHARFIRAVHRRLVIVRALEHLGRCILIGCAVALLLLPILLWHSQPVMPLLLGIGAACVLAAGAMTIRQWPGEMAAAEEADRQLNLADLLATSMELRPVDPLPAPDLLSAAVLAMADARCRELSPSQVVLHRLGIRAWGGVGLSIALVVTLALIPFRPVRSDAADANASVLAQSSSPRPVPADQVTASRQWTQHVARNENDPASDDASRITTAQEQSGDGKNSAAISDSKSNPRAGTGRDFSATGGEGQASSHLIEQQDRPRTNISGSPTQPGGIIASGIGTTSNQGVTGAANGFSAGATSASPVVPPWETTGWPQARQSAGKALSNGQIPDEYHDLVRNYFNRSYDNP
jgi:hypothetical protein